MAQDKDGLGMIRLFEDLSAGDLQEIDQLCTWHSFASGEEILAKNSDSTDVYFVVGGSVGVVNFSVSGREVGYAKVGAGSYFGELAALDGKPRSASVVALEKCRLAALGPNVFEQLICDHPTIGLNVMRKLASVIRSTDDRIMDLSTLGVHQRLYGELVRLCEPDPVTPGRWMIFPMPTQQDLAKQISTSRETVARALSQLNSDGLIQRKGKTLYISDKDQLAALTERLAEGQKG